MKKGENIYQRMEKKILLHFSFASLTSKKLQVSPLFLEQPLSALAMIKKEEKEKDLETHIEKNERKRDGYNGSYSEKRFV